MSKILLAEQDLSLRITDRDEIKKGDLLCLTPEFKSFVREYCNLCINMGISPSATWYKVLKIVELCEEKNLLVEVLSYKIISTPDTGDIKTIEICCIEEPTISVEFGIASKDCSFVTLETKRASYFYRPTEEILNEFSIYRKGPYDKSKYCCCENPMIKKTFIGIAGSGKFIDVCGNCVKDIWR